MQLMQLVTCLSMHSLYFSIRNNFFYATHKSTIPILCIAFIDSYFSHFSNIISPHFLYKYGYKLNLFQSYSHFLEFFSNICKQLLNFSELLEMLFSSS